MQCRSCSKRTHPLRSFVKQSTLVWPQWSMWIKHDSFTMVHRAKWQNWHNPSQPVSALSHTNTTFDHPAQLLLVATSVHIAKLHVWAQSRSGSAANQMKRWDIKKNLFCTVNTHFLQRRSFSKRNDTLVGKYFFIQEHKLHLYIQISIIHVQWRALAQQFFNSSKSSSLHSSVETLSLTWLTDTSRPFSLSTLSRNVLPETLKAHAQNKMQNTQI